MATVISTVGTAGPASEEYRRDYTTLASWESDTDNDLTTAGGTIHIARLFHADSPYDEDSLVFTGATTATTGYRRISPDSKQWHVGRKLTGARVHSDLGGFAAVLNIQEDFFRVTDLEISSDAIETQYGIIVNSSNNNVQISGVVIWHLQYGGINFQGTGDVTNCIVHHSASGDALFGPFQGNAGDTTQVQFIHCTALAEDVDNNKSTTGFRYGVFKNCISMHYGGSAGHLDYLNAGAGTTNNASSDVSADDFSSSGFTGMVSTDLFVYPFNGANTDLHMLPTSPIVASGSGLAAAANFDIDRTSRAIDWPSVGADEYKHGSGTPVLDGDNHLVGLWRMSGWLDAGDEQLDNLTQSTTYIGLNTFQPSGSMVPIDQPGVSGLPAGNPPHHGFVGSGVGFNSTADMFHLHTTSGNQSGMEWNSSSEITFGFFGKPSEIDSLDRTWFAKYYQASDGRSYRIEVASGAADVLLWQLSIARSAGGADTDLPSLGPIHTGHYESVIARMDGPNNDFRLYVSGHLAASSIGVVTNSPGSSGNAQTNIRIGAQRAFNSQAVFHSIGSESGDMAELFFMDRLLSEDEILGIANSGIQAGTPEIIPAEVAISDAGLVALYRYKNAPYISGASLANQAQDLQWKGENTMYASGDFLASFEGPANAPLSSGQFFGSGVSDGTAVGGDFFDTSAISGNMSGLQALSGQSVSFGSFVKISGIEGAGDWSIINRWSDVEADDGIYFNLRLRKTADNIMRYEAAIATQSGATITTVATHDPIDSTTSGTWQSVIAVADGSAGTLDIYVSGLKISGVTNAADGSTVYAPEGSGTALDLKIPFRIGAETNASTNLSPADSFGFEGSGYLAETFVMNRALSKGEVLGIHNSGFIGAAVVLESDQGDTQKDNVGEIDVGAVPNVVLTAWDASDDANPSGMRHALSGTHPAFIKLLGDSIASGLSFADTKQNNVSTPVAITFRSTTTGKILNNMRFWVSDTTAFDGLNGYEIAQHIASEWLPNLILSSGSGSVGRTLGEASSVLRSDKNTDITGAVVTDVPDSSGETNVSQYIYIGFETNNDFTPGTYGPTGFRFRVTVDFSNV